MRSAGAFGAWWITVTCALGCGATATSSGGAEGTTAASQPNRAVVTRCDVPHAPAPIEFEEGMRAAASGDVENSRRLLAVACDSGNPCACTEIGESFVDPADGARDVQRGALLLERGCAGGDIWGCYALGSAIFRFIPDRIEHARDLFEDACEDGVPEACLEIGRFRMTGVDGDRSALDALQFYERACREGVQHACVVLGEAFAEGVGTPRDPKRAAELLTWACEEADVAHACTAWAQHLDVEDEQRSALLRRGCDGGDPVACDALDPDAARRGGEPALRALAARVPSARPVENGSAEIEATIGGVVDLSALGLRPSCVGFVDAEPDAVLSVPEGSSELHVGVRAAADAILAIRDPAGRWLCADDGVAGDYDPSIAIGDPVQGDYLVWAGTLDREPNIPARLLVAAIAPVVVAPPATYESLPEPTPETITMPDARLRHYQLDVTAMPGMTGRVRVDGNEVWAFESRGGHATLDDIQCALQPGRHVIDVEVVQRGRDARLLGGATNLLTVSLHGAMRRSLLTEDESRLHRLEWTPEGPGRRQLVLEVERRQAGDRSTCEE
ncbi:tetratricopeptide repeat protein [Sandaracinus amylolyticus]|uniref:Uncharacterized protein n=1 Tax=Sandaracinus amylolyticus TaxID=927083 RepID=A0A0F6W1A0_9BACT|nr:tetratricopeptide repeat protein [Sandaracinus amylolyticus]AKF04925.1 hypothetical protein DB32_002074 [Sandaracinus amylolyticus]